MPGKDKIFYGVLVAIVIVAGVFLITKKSPSQPSAPVTSSLASLSTAAAPWSPEYAHLSSRLKAINMPLLGVEGTALHIHAHLDIFINGKQVVVPGDIGVPSAGGITPLHTHDTTGIIHVESPDAHAKYTLGQLFDVWGVKFTDNSVGGYINNANQKLAVFSNGLPVTEPAKLAFVAHQEVVITYGTTQQLPKISTSYKFPQGL